MSAYRTRDDCLFLSHAPPHHPVGSKTLARWLCELMAMAGLDTKEFKPHSTRGAAAAFWRRNKSLSIKDICRKADWSLSSGVFRTFYDRYIKWLYCQSPNQRWKFCLLSLIYVFATTLLRNKKILLVEMISSSFRFGFHRFQTKPTRPDHHMRKRTPLFINH